MDRIVRLLLGLCVCLLIAPRSDGSSLLRVENRRPTTGLLVQAEPNNEMTSERALLLYGVSASPMLRELAGVEQPLDARGVNRLTRDARPFDADTLLLHTVGPDAHLILVADFGRTPEPAVRVLDVYRDGEDRALVLDPEADPESRARSRGALFDADGFADAFPSWDNPPAAMLAENGFEPGTVVRAEPPYRPGAIRIDADTLRERLYRTASRRPEPTTRVLNEETFSIRLPRGHDPSDPPGVLVWCHAAPDGSPMPQVFPAADELNLIVASAHDAGNDRYVSDRYQLMLDALSVTRHRFRTDPERVYITGISGGGRISSLLQAGFPDVFMGSVPIVGIDTYEQIPAGGGKSWRADYSKPRGEQWEQFLERRIAPITGPQDGNYQQTLATEAQMSADGVRIKAFVYDDMGHHMPTPGRFLEALSWVDQPQQLAREERAARARDMLAKLYEQHTSDPPTDDPEVVGVLVEVTAIAPWSAPAWEAAELLGFERSGVIKDD